MVIHNKLNAYKKQNMLDVLEEEKSVENTDALGRTPTLGSSELKSPVTIDNKTSLKSGTSESSISHQRRAISHNQESSKKVGKLIQSS